MDLLPAFVGAASGANDSLEWKGACFYKNRAWMEFHNKSGSAYGGGTLHIKVKFDSLCLSIDLGGTAGLDFCCVCGMILGEATVLVTCLGEQFVLD